jgi:superfamily I DNA/RNA helicase
VWANQFLDDIGYFNELRRSEKNPETAEGRIRNLKELTSSMDGDDAVSQVLLVKLRLLYLSGKPGQFVGIAIHSALLDRNPDARGAWEHHVPRRR